MKLLESNQIKSGALIGLGLTLSFVVASFYCGDIQKWGFCEKEGYFGLEIILIWALFTAAYFFLTAIVIYLINHSITNTLKTFAISLCVPLLVYFLLIITKVLLFGWTSLGRRPISPIETFLDNLTPWTTTFSGFSGIVFFYYLLHIIIVWLPAFLLGAGLGFLAIRILQKLK